LDHDASSRTPVDESETVSGFQIGIVLIGISITLPLMYSAGELAQGIGLSKAIMATLTGALILSLMSIPAAIVGVKTRLSSYMIIEHTFGFAGAKFVNFWFGVFLLGWYAVTAELFGRTLFLAASELTTLGIPEWGYTVLSSALVTATTIYGFKAIDRLALVAVPFLLLALMAVVVLSLQKTAFSDLLLIEAEGMDMPTAISAVVGAAIVGVVLTPDLTRYARNVRDCITASFLGQGGGMTIAYVVGMIPVLVWNELEPMNYMFMIGYGGMALAVIVFATWTTNVINLYSTALSARASVPLGQYRSVVIVSGIVGTIAAVVGISENLIEFLIVMGLLVPPIAGVYLVDFFYFKRTDFSPQRLEGRPAIRVNATVVGLGTGIVSARMFFSGSSLTSIGALDSLFISMAAYIALQKITGKSDE
jgi:cytosine permease